MREVRVREESSGERREQGKDGWREAGFERDAAQRGSDVAFLT